MQEHKMVYMDYTDWLEFTEKGAWVFPNPEALAEHVPCVKKCGIVFALLVPKNLSNLEPESSALHGGCI